MKYLLVLYMCSLTTNQCPSSHYAGYQFDTHYDCVMGGYAVAQKTFKNLKEMEEFDKQYIEEKKIVVKFECKGIKVDDKDKEKNNTKKLSVKS